MSDASQDPVEAQKPDDENKPDAQSVPENTSQPQPPVPSPTETPKSDEPRVWFEPELPPMGGPEIPDAEFNEHGSYRNPDRDQDLFEMGVVEPLLGLGMDEKPIEWLWPGYIPVGKLTLIEGESACGKSFVLADIAARVSRGQPWPGRVPEAQPAGDVIVVSLEDGREDTLVPRLRQAGANLRPPEGASASPVTWGEFGCGRSPDSCGRSPDRATRTDRRSPEATPSDNGSFPDAAGDLRSTAVARTTALCGGAQDRPQPSAARQGCIFFFTAISEYDALKEKGETVRNRRPVFDADLVHLEYAIRRNENVRLVVIDSLPGLCPDRKSYRQALRQLEEIARRRNVAIVATARPSTRRRGQPRVEGDKLSEEVRCLFHVLCDPEDPQTGSKQRRFLAPVRMNFCEEPEWLAFRMASGALVWETPSDDGPLLSSCVASPTRQKAVRLHEAINWLKEELQDENQSATRMKDEARTLGFADITVRRACERLGVRHVRRYFGPIGSWAWALPKPDEEAAEARHGENGEAHRRGGKSKKGRAKGRRKVPEAQPGVPEALDRTDFDEGSLLSNGFPTKPR